MKIHFDINIKPAANDDSQIAKEPPNWGDSIIISASEVSWCGESLISTVSFDMYFYDLDTLAG